MNPNDLRKLRERYPISESVARANRDVDGVAPGSKCERDIENEPVEKNEGKAPDQIRSFVRYTLFRVRAIEDQENFFTKHFTDALTISGLIFDDSQQWCRIEVTQEQVANKAEERTVITIEPMP